MRGAGGVQQAAAGRDPLRGALEDRLLDAREADWIVGFLAPAGVGSPPDDADAGTRRVDERGVQFLRHRISIWLLGVRPHGHDRGRRFCGEPTHVLEFALVIVDRINRALAAKPRCDHAGFYPAACARVEDRLAGFWRPQVHRELTLLALDD